MRKISGFIIVTIIVNSLIFSNLSAQNAAASADSAIFRGVRLEVDLLSPLMHAIGASKGFYYQGAAAVNLNEKYFPTIEIGYGALDNKLSASGLTCNARALYYRIGLDYNVLNSKKPLRAMNNIFSIGARLGGSNLSYNIENVKITDDYWGGSKTLDLPNQRKFMIWWEVIAGVRVEILNNIFMGWNVRMKNVFSAPKQGEVYPYYIPGLGLYNGGKWEFNYYIGWQL
ncbi:MAG: DUF6048 family protein [Paludibacter sp.]|nr:DUF6048 family protein [Paludibacter sp.]